MKFQKTMFLILMAPVFGIAIWVGSGLWTTRHWFSLQHQQMATIMKLAAIPPLDCNGEAWRDAVITLNNVWGNVTFHPTYSSISNGEMLLLQSQLDRILVKTTPDNSVESVDEVYKLLLQRGSKTDFISGYHQEFLRHNGRMSHMENDSTKSK